MSPVNTVMQSMLRQAGTSPAVDQRPLVGLNPIRWLNAAAEPDASQMPKVPNTSATAASSGSDLNGMAARAAAETIRGRLADFIADKHQVQAANVRFEGGLVKVAGEHYAFAQVAAWAYQARISLSSTGYYATPKITWDRMRGRGRPFLYFAYGAAVSEVVIDTLTGENRILRVDILHDTGTSLNPALDIGQVEGAYVQGAGWLTTEELVMTHELVASMLGVRRETITDVAGELQRAGCIRYRRGHIAVLDRHGLETRACECYAVVRKELRRLLSDVQYRQGAG